jgi:hypothetical protein
MSRSGHSGGSGVSKDAEKCSLAATLGWRIFQLTEDKISRPQLNIIAETILNSRIQPKGLEEWQLKYLIEIQTPNKVTYQGLNNLKCGLAPKYLSAFEIKARKYFTYSEGLWVQKIWSEIQVEEEICLQP